MAAHVHTAFVRYLLCTYFRFQPQHGHELLVNDVLDITPCLF